MADANDPLKRQRALDSLAVGASRTFTQTIDGSQYTATLSNPQIRTLNGSQVFSVDMQVTKDGVLFFDDRINMPNPPQGVRRPNGSVQDNPLQALRDSLLDVLGVCTHRLTTPHLMRGQDGLFLGDTLAVRSATTDGTVTSSNATFATMAAGSGLTAATATSPITMAWQLVGGPTYRGRYFFTEYDTSSLGATVTITAAVYTLYGESSAEFDVDNYNLEARYKDWGGTVTTADWFDPRSGVWSGLVSGGSLDVGTWNETDGTANNLSDSGVYTSIAKTGTTRIVFGFSGMDSSTPTGNNTVNTYTADNAGTSSDPLLTVTYTLPKAPPPLSSYKYSSRLRR